MSYPFLTPFDYWRAGLKTWCRMAEAQMAITAHCMSMAAGTAPLPQKTVASRGKSAPITLAALRAATARTSEPTTVVPIAAYSASKRQPRASQPAR